MTLAWIPEQDVGGKDNKQRSDELRIRASNLELAAALENGLRPLAAKLSPALGDVWRSTQPSGKINTLALDIPLQAANQDPFFRHRGAIWPGSNGNYYRVRNASPGRFPAALKMVCNYRVDEAKAKMPYETAYSVRHWKSPTARQL
ncbi:hypothetical protein MJ391_25525 [Escherichia coli]|nr:hypothetical protein MJ391_25525 [Escherichia coli]